MMTLVPTQHPLDRSIAAFQKSLDKIAKHGKSSSATGNPSPSNTSSCVITLCKVLDNILLERQYNPKTRSIKLSNQLFRERVGSVPGGVEFLLACHFKYVRLASKTPEKQKPNGSAPGNAVKLSKDNENRDVLVAARRYLQEYGIEVMNLHPGKHRNELPPFVIHDDIPTDALQRIQDNVHAVASANGGARIENMESISQRRSQEYDLSCTSSVVTPMSQGVHMSESAPPSPDTMCTAPDISPDDMSLSSAFSYGNQSFVSSGGSFVDQDCFEEKKESAEESQAYIATEETATNTKTDLAMKRPVAISPISRAQPQQKIENSPNGVADSEQMKESSLKREQSLEARLDQLNVRKIGGSMDLDSLDGDDQSLGTVENDEKRRIFSLTKEEIDSLEHISKCDNFDGRSEDERVLSVATGKATRIDQSRNSSKSNSLFTKLNKLAQKKDKKGRGEDVNDHKTVATIASNSIIRIKNSDGLSVDATCPGRTSRRGNRDTKPTPAESVEIKASDGADAHHKAAIDVGLKLFFAIFVVTYNFGDDFLTDEQLLEADTVDESDTVGPLVPIEILYKLWSTFLRSERSFNAMDGREVYQTFIEVARSQVGDIEDKSMLASLGENDIRACKYIIRALHDSGLVYVSEISLRMHQSSIGGRNSQNRVAIGLRGEASQPYGLELAGCLNIQYETNDTSNPPRQKSDLDVAIERLRTRCHNIIGRSLRESIDLESTDAIFIDENADFDLLST
jgi:hypothetical protein